MIIKKLIEGYIGDVYRCPVCGAAMEQDAGYADPDDRHLKCPNHECGITASLEH